MDFGLLSVDTTDELRSVFASTTKIGSASHGSECPPRSHSISDVTADRVSRTKAKNHFKKKYEFETRRDKLVDQDFGRQNDPMSQPPLESTPLGTNTTHRTTSPSDLIPVGTKPPKLTPLTLPTDQLALPTDISVEPDPDPSLSYIRNILIS